jgi:hypothetical protein
VLAAVAGSQGAASTKNLAPSATEIVDMVGRYLRTLAEDYAVVTVAVPFSKFNILIGEIVEVTSVWIPDGLGGRGVAGKKAVCVGRDWSLDPGQNEMGKLTLWFPRDAGRTAGYCPSGRITGQSNTGGNNWTLTFSIANTWNLAWSESSDGNITKHYDVGDIIKIVQSDSTSPTEKNGTVTAVSNTSHTISVALTSSWTPSSTTWDLTWAADSTPTDRQLSYCWVADSDGELIDGAAARQFV